MKTPDIVVVKFKPLTTKNAVLGIGRKFTDEELTEYIERTSGGQAKSAAKVKKDLKARLALVPAELNIGRISNK